MGNAKKRLMMAKQAERFEAMNQSALKKPCGRRAKYTAGCRCDLCKEANRRYYHRNAIQRIQKGPILIDPQPAKLHLARLRRNGFGLRWIAEQSGLSRSGLQRLIKENKSIKRETAAKLLAVDGSKLKRGHRISAAKSRQYVEQLINDGFTRNKINRMAKTQFAYSMDVCRQISPLTAARISMLANRFLLRA